MERILQLVENVPKLPRERIDWLVNHTGRVDKLSFQVGKRKARVGIKGVH